MTQSDLPHLPVRLDEAKRAPLRLTLSLDAHERGTLAALHGLDAVKAFHMVATAQTLKRRKLRVDGIITANVTYRCGVTLTPYDAALDVPFSQLFGDEEGSGQGPAARTSTDTMSQPREIEIDPFDDDDLEPLTDGAADIADLAYQLFAIALDPYPRHPSLPPPTADNSPDEGAPADGSEAEATSPFAVLKQLKD